MMIAKKREPKTPTNAGYQEFIRGLKLAALGLSSANARLDRDLYFATLQDEAETAQRRIDASFKLTDTGEDFFESEATFSLDVSTKEGKEALHVDCKFTLHFHVEGYVEEHARTFGERDVKLITWPYFRQFVTDITSRMTIPPVTIPLSTQQPA